MNQLMLHCGSRLATREEVFAAPIPEATRTYVPLSHEAFLTRIEKSLGIEGMEVREEQLALGHDGQRLFGVLHVQMPAFAGRDYGCVLGLRNSYDKSFAVGLCVGASVFVCDNLSFHSEVTFERKHTTNLLKDLSWLISETVNQLPVKFASQAQTFESYRNTELTDPQVHDLVIRSLDAGAVNVTMIPRLVNEWREPRHEAFRIGKHAFRLFNAFTEVLKGDIWRLPARTQKIHRILDDECGIVRVEESCIVV